MMGKVSLAAYGDFLERIHNDYYIECRKERTIF